MDNWFRKLGNRREPLGLETRLLKRMPMIFVTGFAAHVAVAVLARLLLNSAPAKLITSIDIFLIASAITFWTALVTAAIACFIVFVMKGPAYVADAYPLNEASTPRR